ncbi:hypothetical protein CSUI_007529, partial [Cystoisospora suis]
QVRHPRARGESDGEKCSFYDVPDLQTGVTRRLSHRLLRQFTPSVLTRDVSPDPYFADLYLPKARGATYGDEEIPGQAESPPHVQGSPGTTQIEERGTPGADPLEEKRRERNQGCWRAPTDCTEQRG